MEEKNIKIENAKITSVYLGEDHGCLTVWLGLEGGGWFCNFGGYNLCHFVKLQKKNNCGNVLVAIMTTIGVTSWEDVKNKYIRVKTEGWGGKIVEIGNLIEDKWFGFSKFYEEIKNFQGDN